MKEQPAWIEMLFKRGFGGHPFHGPPLLQRHREHILEVISVDPSNGEELRQAALEALHSADRRRRIQGLGFLLVVGKKGDMTAIQRLAEDSDENVRKAVKTCSFELRKRTDSTPSPPVSPEP